MEVKNKEKKKTKKKQFRFPPFHSSPKTGMEISETGLAYTVFFSSFFVNHRGLTFRCVRINGLHQVRFKPGYRLGAMRLTSLG